MSETKQPDRFDSWGIVELMGHVRIAGRVTEEEHFGAKLGRIDIPMPDGGFVTQYFGVSSIYRLTPTDEATARSVAASNRPEPVHRWELPAALPAPRGVDRDYDQENPSDPDIDDDDDTD